MFYEFNCSIDQLVYNKLFHFFRFIYSPSDFWFKLSSNITSFIKSSDIAEIFVRLQLDCIVTL